MRRLAIFCALAAATVSNAAAATVHPRAVLNGFVCHHAANPLNREIFITAVMRPIPETQRMALKFELQRSIGGSPFADVKSGDLGKWIYPTNPPTLGQQPADVWRYNKPVVNLPDGEYRFRVAFRWLGRDASVLRTTVRFSPRCDQR
jgi:hypothetical protein